MIGSDGWQNLRKGQVTLQEMCIYIILSVIVLECEGFVRGPELTRTLNICILWTC